MSRLTVISAFFVAVMLAVGASSPAFAHDDIVATTPPNGGSVKKVPAKVLIEFAEEPASGGARVTGPGGGRNLAGPTKIRGSILVIPLRSAEESGWYSVEVTASSDDGHEISATVEFEVLEPQPKKTSTNTTTESAGEDEQAPADAQPETTPTTADNASATGVALAGVAVIGAVLGGAWWAISRRKRPQ